MFFPFTGHLFSSSFQLFVDNLDQFGNKIANERQVEDDQPLHDVEQQGRQQRRTQGESEAAGYFRRRN